MKIGVNARLLTKPFTGIGLYTKNMFKELAKIGEEDQYILVVPEKLPDSLVRIFPNNVEIVVLPEKRLPTAGARKTWWEQIQLPEYFLKEKVDVAFYTYPSNPWTKDWYKKGIKTVVVVHDCIPWMNKNYRKGILSKLYHAQTRKAVAKANLVVTVSGSSLEDILKVCKIDRDKVEVVYNDADEIYKEPLNKEFMDEVLHRFSLKAEKFFLYVGGYDERKNVKKLVSEFEKFEKKHPNIPLVLAGGKLFKSKLYKSFDEKELGNIVKTGFLEAEDLAVLYKNCLAFVNLSKHEGFNIPILEAANCDAAMILSDIPVHKEVAEDSAIFVDTNKAGEAAGAMETMLKEKKSRDGFKAKSGILAKKYSWKKYAKILRNIL